MQVLGELRQGKGQPVIAQARKKQHPGIVEIALPLVLHLAHGPLLQNVIETPSGRHRDALDPTRQPATGLVRRRAQARAMSIFIDTQTQHSGLLFPTLEQLHGRVQTAVRPDTLNAHVLTHERRHKLEIVAGATQADAHDFLHRLIVGKTVPLLHANNQSSLIWHRLQHLTFARAG